jgi:hypothetical protein
MTALESGPVRRQIASARHRRRHKPVQLVPCGFQCIYRRKGRILHLVLDPCLVRVGGSQWPIHKVKQGNSREPGEGFCGRNQVCTHLVSPSRRSGPLYSNTAFSSHLSTSILRTRAKRRKALTIVVRRKPCIDTSPFINCSFIANKRYKVTRTGDAR